jgi:hypothetical protein
MSSVEGSLSESRSVREAIWHGRRLLQAGLSDADEPWWKTVCKSSGQHLNADSHLHSP